MWQFRSGVLGPRANVENVLVKDSERPVLAAKADLCRLSPGPHLAKSTLPHNGLAHLPPVSGAAVANARAVTDASGGQCSDLLGGAIPLLDAQTQ